MPLTSYIGQYGESLRRLTALGNQAPQNMGGADMSALPPPAMPGQIDRNAQAAQGSFDQSGVPGGALSASPASAPAQGAFSTAGAPAAPASAAAPGGGPPPISFGDMTNGATHADKEKALANLKKHVDIDEEFGALQEHGIVPKDAKMSTHDKGMLVMEFGLRMMSATAQGADAAGAAGIAGQGLLESYRARKDSDQKEATRISERQQDRTDKAADRASQSQDRVNDNNVRQTISYQEQAGASNRNTADIKSREKIAELEAKTRLKEAQTRAAVEKTPIHFTDANGDLKLVDASGNVTTPTEETTDAKTGKKSRKTVKPAQTNANGIDQDRTQALIEKEKERLSKDPATMREMRGKKMTAADQDASLEKQARKNVQSRLPITAGGADPLNLGLE